MQIQSVTPTIQDPTFNQLLKQVNQTNTGVIVKGAGNIDGVLITKREYEQMQQRRQEALNDLSKMIGEMRATVAQSELSSEEIETVIDEAVQEVRQEAQEKKAALSSTP
jgi:PHD/YefM family antitoxin component YafN of YafNO toxin-antitoxin module